MAEQKTFVTVRMVRVRNAAGLGGNHVRWLQADEQVSVDADSRTEHDGYVWWRHADGWSAEKSTDGSNVFMTEVAAAPAEDTQPVAEEPPAEPPADDGKRFYVGADRVRVRSAPNLGGQSLGWLESGEVIAVVPDSQSQANGYIWWQHDAGYSAERSLDGGLTFLFPTTKPAGSFAGPVPANEAERARLAAFNITAAFEGAGYGTYQDYDAGIISYGRFQFTLASNNLQNVLARYLDAASSGTATALRGYMARVRAKDATLKDEVQFEQLLKKAANEVEMQEAQDDIATEAFWNLVQELTIQPRNIQSALGQALCFDMAINHGPYHDMFDEAEDALGVGRKSRVPDNGITEEQLISKLAAVRLDRMNRLADARGPAYEGLRQRGQFWADLTTTGDWTLRGDAKGMLEVKSGRRVRVWWPGVEATAEDTPADDALPAPSPAETSYPADVVPPAADIPSTPVDPDPEPVETTPAADAVTEFVVGRAQVRVRGGAGLTFAHVKWLNPGERLNIVPDSRTEADGYIWWQHDAGWSAEKNLAGTQIFLYSPAEFEDRPALEDVPQFVDGLPDPATLPLLDTLFKRLPVALSQTRWWQYFGNNVFAYNLWAQGKTWYSYAQGLHGGVDFGNSTDAGVKVYAGVENGVFNKKDTAYTRPNGMWVTVGDYTIIYGHLTNVPDLQPGAAVGVDTVLGEIQLGGQNHLHLEIRYKGQYIVNPILFFSPTDRDAIVSKWPPGSRYFYQGGGWSEWITPLDQPVLKLGGELIGPHAR